MTDMRVLVGHGAKQYTLYRYTVYGKLVCTIIQIETKFTKHLRNLTTEITHKLTLNLF